MADVLDLILWLAVFIGPIIAWQVWRLSDNNVKRHERQRRRKGWR